MDGAIVLECYNPPIPRCVHCKGPLKFPIREVADIGNFCTTCFDKSGYIDDEDEIEGTTDFEYIPIKLVMPCKYGFRGCDESGTPLNISKHEKVCVYRDKLCPFYELKKCSVADHITDLSRHFSEFHPSQIRVSDNNSLELEYEFTDQNFNEFSILVFEEDNVLLNAQTKGDKLYFSCYFIGSAEDFRFLTCKIQPHNSDVYTTEKSCKILPYEKLGNSEGASATLYDKVLLERYFGQRLITTITLETDMSNVSNEEILMRLECPVCSNFMRNSIKLCSVGHSVCNECESKLDKCPICTLPFCGGRNFALEGIGDLLKILVRNERLECPLKKELQCPWRGTDANILEHVKDLHNDKIIVNKRLKRVLEYTPEFLEVNYLVSYGQVFKLMCRKDKYDDVMAVVIELIGHDEDAQRYHYNVSFNSLYKQSIIWYTKSRVLARRRVEFYVDYLAISRIVCNNQFDISYTITESNNN